MAKGVDFLEPAGARSGSITVVRKGRHACRSFRPSRPPRFMRLRDQSDQPHNSKDVAQGKPVARRGRKARDLPETARLPTSSNRHDP